MNDRELSKRNRPSKKSMMALFIIAEVVSSVLAGLAMWRSLGGDRGFAPVILCLSALGVLVTAIIIGEKRGLI